MRIRLAALCVRWSPDGAKFAVGSSDKSLSACHFDAQNSWWACRSLAKARHTSSIVAVGWHPTSQLLATACMDGVCRVINAMLPGGMRGHIHRASSASSDVALPPGAVCILGVWAPMLAASRGHLNNTTWNSWAGGQGRLQWPPGLGEVLATQGGGAADGVHDGDPSRTWDSVPWWL